MTVPRYSLSITDLIADYATFMDHAIVTQQLRNDYRPWPPCAPGVAPSPRCRAPCTPAERLRSAHKSLKGLWIRLLELRDTLAPAAVPGFGVRLHPGLTKACARCAGCRAGTSLHRSEPAARGPQIPSGRSIGLRSDSPRSGRLLSLARGAGERQTPVRGVRSADRSRNTLDSGRSSTCVPNVARSGGAGRAAAGKGAPHRRPVASVRGQLALGRALPESRP